jgi:hypothetical protein
MFGTRFDFFVRAQPAFLVRANKQARDSVASQIINSREDLSAVSSGKRRRLILRSIRAYERPTACRVILNGTACHRQTGNYPASGCALMSPP